MNVPLANTDPLSQAQASLAHLIAWHHHHHPSLENIWAGLVPLAEKITHPVWQVAVLGQVSRGKSALINALIGTPQFATGPTHGVTLWPHSIRWQPDFGGQVFDVDLTDTPGLDELGGQARAAMAWDVAQQADLVLFVTAGPLNPVELNALEKLRDLKVTVFLVANKQDLYLAWTKADMELQLHQAGLGDFLDSDQMVLVSAAPGGEPGLDLPEPHLDPLHTLLAQWFLTTARQARATQILHQACQIEQNLGTALLAQTPPPLSAYWFLPLSGLGLFWMPGEWLDVLIGVGSSFGLVRFLCRYYGIPLTPPSSGQAGRVILITTLGIGLTGATSWAWLLGEPSLGGGLGSGLGQVAVWAWGLTRVRDIIKTHVAQGYIGGSWGPETLLKKT